MACTKNPELCKQASMVRGYLARPCLQGYLKEACFLPHSSSSNTLTNPISSLFSIPHCYSQLLSSSRCSTLFSLGFLDVGFYPSPHHKLPIICILCIWFL